MDLHYYELVRRYSLKRAKRLWNRNKAMSKVPFPLVAKT